MKIYSSIDWAMAIICTGENFQPFHTRNLYFIFIMRKEEKGVQKNIEHHYIAKNALFLYKCRTIRKNYFLILIFIVQLVVLI